MGAAAYGAAKYGLHNWKKGLHVRDVASSLLRHLTAFLNGEDIDEESGLSHTGAIAWNALMLSEMYRRPDMDDRDRSAGPAQPSSEIEMDAARYRWLRSHNDKRFILWDRGTADLTQKPGPVLCLDMVIDEQRHVT